MSRTCLVALSLLGVAVASAGPGRAEEAPRSLPAAEGLVLDGRLDEAAWSDALVVPAATVDVPDVESPTGTRPLAVDVRLLRDDRGAWIGVRADESPGAGLGLHVFVAGPEALTAADAWGFTYRPFELRADRVAVVAPFVDARVHLPVDAASDISQRDRWTLEAYVPLGPVHADAGAPRRLGMAVLTRTVNVVADAPAGVFARGPGHWLPVAAPKGGWKAPAADAAALEAEARRELDRRTAFAGWLRALFEGEAADARPAFRAMSRLAARVRQTEPLDRMLEARPDLFVPIEVARGDILERMGFFDEAATAYEAALARAPGWNEARYGLHARLAARRALEAPAGEPNDLAALDARIAALEEAAGDDPWRRAGVALARAERAYRLNEADAAATLLEPLRERFPGDAWIVQLGERIASARQSEPIERRAWSTPPSPRPRVRVTTPRGPVVVELFEDDAMQAVAQWIWLVQKGFYDGLAVHHTVPGCWVAFGDPGTADGASEAARADVGAGGPGYSIEVPDSPRRPRRGAVALERTAEGVVGSRFLFVTGTVGELSDVLVVIGHVVEGAEAVDGLRQGDRLGPFAIEHLREGTVYRPLGRDGLPAPEPTR
ncbi:MAG: peptidylprolyl isomerase [Planctomycetota bacterium]